MSNDELIELMAHCNDKRCIEEAKRMLSVVKANIGAVAKPCVTCYGHGFDPDDVISQCLTCNGSGVIAE